MDPERRDEIAIEDDAVITIAKMLQGCEDSLEALRIAPLPTGSFGGSSSGAQLGQHTELARKSAKQVVDAMTTGVRNLEKDLRRFDTEARYADEDAQMRARNLLVKLGAL